jgi:hypothetical protein
MHAVSKNSAPKVAVMCWDGSCMLKSEMAASQVIKIVDKERR